MDLYIPVPPILRELGICSSAWRAARVHTGGQFRTIRGPDMIARVHTDDLLEWLNRVWRNPAPTAEMIARIMAHAAPAGAGRTVRL